MDLRHTIHGRLVVLGTILSAGAAVLVYSNTLPAGFAFDDNFAVLYNGDVTNDSNPLSGLLKNDFWGQNIQSEQSHKSFRPLAVLAFRLIRQAWQALPDAWRAPVREWRMSLVTHEASETDAAKLQGRGDVDPLPFHAANVVMHAVASAMVCLLSYHLFSLRLALGQDTQSVATSQTKHKQAVGNGSAGMKKSEVTHVTHAAEAPASSVSGAGMRQRTGGSKASNRTESGGHPHTNSSQTEQPQRGTDQPCDEQGDPLDMYETIGMISTQPSGLSWFLQVDLPSWFVGVAFALHPVHTEAVAGIVGQAELLSTLFSIPALLAYFSAADSDSVVHLASHVSAWSHKRGLLCLLDGSTRIGHWAQVAAAMVLAFAAALSKEIGITVCATMLAYDVLLVPLQPAISSKTPWSLTQVLSHRKWRRMAMAAITAVAYVNMRSSIAVDQLVRIYRKVENPIPFAEDAKTRLLSTLFLHARYAGLLVWPVSLSADWSFACIPLVETLQDPRNAASAALYLTLIVLALASRPWAILREWAQAGSRAEGSVWRARWRAMVASGLIVAPFLPASNAFFYVGTFIGERLLYTPSIGFLLLCAEVGIASGVARCVAAALADGHLHPPQPSPVAVGEASAPAGSPAAATAGVRGAGQPSRSTAVRMAAAMAATLLGAACVVCLGFYAGRTWARNWDWLNEERLFVSAQQVCGRSAKVQLNSGILARRYGKLAWARDHFEAARALEPGYCEPSYWLGITALNMGNVQVALTELEAAVGCKYVAADALRTLNTIYGVMRNSVPKDGLPLGRWGTVLVKPEVDRAGEGCELLEGAALLYAVHGRDISSALTAIMICEDALKGKLGVMQPSSNGGRSLKPTVMVTPDPVLEGASPQRLLECLSARRPVYTTIGNHGLHSPYVRQAVYTYLTWVMTESPDCRGSSSLTNSDMGDQEAQWRPTPHAQLVHSIQAVHPGDAWLQREWGEVLASAPGRTQEAATHFAVAAMLLTREVETMRAGSSPPTQLAMDGKLLDEHTAFAGIADAYTKAAMALLGASANLEQLQVAPSVPVGACDLLVRGMEARHGALQLAPQEHQRRAHQAAIYAGTNVLTTLATSGLVECQAALAKLEILQRQLS